ncbi:M48 family metallopeptidase [Lentisalinibacter salinarum]|uniref:M48 family metallopeptidase n=1 Tax=Lentisalinibacter salinarum TaxID=2992239 RepID=UPI0038678096
MTRLQLGDTSVDVVFKDIRNVHLSVHPPSGEVRISAPLNTDLDALRLFAISKLGWIKRHQKRQLGQAREEPREYIERESHYLWGRRYLLRLWESSRAAVEVGHRHIDLFVQPAASTEKRREVLESYYRSELRDKASKFIQKWEKQLGVNASKFFVQKMKTKWGSSNPAARNIRLNLELAKKDIDCLDYIVLHELTHFIEPTHSDAFMRILDSNMPNWRHVKKHLNDLPLCQIGS